jgi:ADP-ribose pyrophosphatase YjhB (NUDIX family)
VAVKLVADVAVVAHGLVLLVRYEDVSRYDGQRGWFLPDDYLGNGEHPDATARRILREQAGLQLEPTLAEIESLANGAWHLIFHYRAAGTVPDPVQAGPNVAAAEWFMLDALPPDAEQAHQGWARDVLSRLFPDKD